MLIITPLRIGKLLLFCFPCKRRYKNVRTYSCIAKPLVTDPKVNYGLMKKYTKFITTGQSAQRLCFCIGHINHCSINKILTKYQLTCTICMILILAQIFIIHVVTITRTEYTAAMITACIVYTVHAKITERLQFLRNISRMRTT